MGLIINQAAIEKIKELISKGVIDTKTVWAVAKPTKEQEDHYIAMNGWENYGLWFLAINPETDVHLKHHFEFPVGDFKKIFRSGLIAAKKRAAQFHDEDLVKVIDELLSMINE